jgi:hypothetical protein
MLFAYSFDEPYNPAAATAGETYQGMSEYVFRHRTVLIIAMAARDSLLMQDRDTPVSLRVCSNSAVAIRSSW